MKPCCFCGLRVGAYIIGIIEIIVWSFVLLFTGFSIGLVLNSSSRNETLPIYDQEIDPDPDYTRDTSINDITQFYVIFTLIIILSIIRILVASLLLIGVRKNSLILVKTWLAIKIMVLFCSLALFLYSLVYYRHISQASLDFVAILFDIYLIFVIYSLILEMKGEIQGSHPFPKARESNSSNSKAKKGVGLHEKENQ